MQRDLHRTELTVGVNSNENQNNENRQNETPGSSADNTATSRPRMDQISPEIDAQDVPRPGRSTSPNSLEIRQNRTYVGRRIESENDWVN